MPSSPSVDHAPPAWPPSGSSASTNLALLAPRIHRQTRGSLEFGGAFAGRPACVLVIHSVLGVSRHPLGTPGGSKTSRRPSGKREIRRCLRRPQSTMRLQHGLLRAPRPRRISRFRPHESTAKLELAACPKNHSGLRSALLPDIVFSKRAVAETRRGGTSTAFQLLDLGQNHSWSTGGASARKHFLNRLLATLLLDRRADSFVGRGWARSVRLPGCCSSRQLPGPLFHRGRERQWSLLG